MLFLLLEHITIHQLARPEGCDAFIWSSTWN